MCIETTMVERINNLFELYRVFWKDSFNASLLKKIENGQKKNYRFISKYIENRNNILSVINKLEKSSLLMKMGDNYSLHISALSPITFCKTIIEENLDEQEVKYHVCKCIRGIIFPALSPKAKQSLIVLCNTINKEMMELSKEDASIKNLPYNERIYPLFKKEIAKILTNEVEQDKCIEMFIHISTLIGYIQPSFKLGCIRIRTAIFDAEYLVSNLYGMPTHIQGFDNLFGGGGPIIPDNSIAEELMISGRMFLIRGRYGTGKTLLSLQIAAEVARKGGVSFVMTFEQRAAEYLYALESMNIRFNNNEAIVVTNVLKAVEALEKPQKDCGALIILEDDKTSYKAFLNDILSKVDLLSKYPIKLVVVDPINSLTDIEKNNQENYPFRQETVISAEKAKENGINIILVAEDGSADTSNLTFEENISDVVINLSTTTIHNYAKRFIEIRKSRHQREQRGSHVFSIVPNVGIMIYQSSASVMARVRMRNIHKPVPTLFGYKPFDEIMGENSIYRGDVIVFQGPSGSLKTQLGIIFLTIRELISDIHNEQIEDEVYSFKKQYKDKSFSLLISARDTEESVKFQVNRSYLFVQNNIRKEKKNEKEGLVIGKEDKNDGGSQIKKLKNTDQIIIVDLPQGHISPGYVIYKIELEFEKAKKNGYTIDRVLIDNVAHWELSCPFINDDESFGDVLIDFLRRRKVTSLIICGSPNDNEYSVMQKTIVDNADCLVQFSRYLFRGTSHTSFRIIKSRGMNHRRESFELICNQGNFDIKPSSSLLRITGDQEVNPIKVRLFLHSESDMQKTYNRSIEHFVKSVLSRETEIDIQEKIYIMHALALGSSSALDELQIMQLDEFQLRMSTLEDVNDTTLYKFSEYMWESSWNKFYEPYKKLSIGNKGFYAVPFFSNISFLAYRNKYINENQLKSWERIEEECIKWDPKQNNDLVFFGFPNFTDENLNCLFLEILLSLSELPLCEHDLLKDVDYCPFVAWIQKKEAVKAARIFRRLIKSSRESQEIIKNYQINNKNTNNDNDTYLIDENAILWRHWYTTANQMFCRMDKENRNEIQITELPNGISIAGEWYLSLPSYSAAPDIGLQMIKKMTSVEAELDRLRKGIGLPVRKDYYCSGNDQLDIEEMISPFYSFKVNRLRKIIEQSFRRSDLGCYYQLSDILTFTLRHISEMPDENIEKNIKNMLINIDSKLKFIKEPKICINCKFRKQP